jgi:ketosteroid isomerase-like protein
MVAVVAAIVALQASQPVRAGDALTRATLLDRIQIEDMLTAYYWDMTTEQRRGLAANYLEDGVLEVNGLVLEGREAIRKFLSQEMPLGPAGSTYDLVLNNPRISIQGKTATADIMWSGVVSANVKDPPKLVEQGREHTELVKQKGRWYIKKRVVKSLAGLPVPPSN